MARKEPPKGGGADVVDGFLDESALVGGDKKDDVFAAGVDAGEFGADGGGDRNSVRAGLFVDAEAKHRATVNANETAEVFVAEGDEGDIADAYWLAVDLGDNCLLDFAEGGKFAAGADVDLADAGGHSAAREIDVTAVKGGLDVGGGRRGQGVGGEHADGRVGGEGTARGRVSDARERGEDGFRP